MVYFIRLALLISPRFVFGLVIRLESHAIFENYYILNLPLICDCFDMLCLSKLSLRNDLSIYQIILLIWRFIVQIDSAILHLMTCRLRKYFLFLCLIEGIVLGIPCARNARYSGHTHTKLIFLFSNQRNIWLFPFDEVTLLTQWLFQLNILHLEIAFDKCLTNWLLRFDRILSFA